MNKLTLLVLVVSASFGGTVVAAGTGTICGEVCDSATGDPIPYSIVYIEGTTMGAQADVQGRYCIKDVPTGCFTLEAALYGYGTARVTEVQVRVDSTTFVDFVLAEVAVDHDCTITTTPRDLFNITESSKVQMITSWQIKTLPAKTVYELLRKRGGVVYR